MGHKASKSTRHSLEPSAPPVAASEGVDRALECPVCLDVFRDPAVLACCGQSCCSGCLANLTHCPLCASTLPPISAMAKNRVLAQICEEYSKKQPAPSSSAPSSSSSSKPRLQRQSSMRQCLICMDSTVGALVCNNRNDHAVCRLCFPPYVKSVCEDAGKFKDCGFVIHCPEPKCKAKKPWSTADVTSSLLMVPDQKDVLDLFINSLVRAAHRVEQQQDHEEELTTNVQRILAEALCLKCPSRFCKTVLDADPDGCCAMRCTRCGTHFCWLCLKALSSSNAAHDHVRKCLKNPQQGQLFLPKADKVLAQRAVRLEIIHKKLAKRLGADWKAKEDVLRSIRASDAILEGTELIPEDIISGTLRTVQSPRRAQPQPQPQAGVGAEGRRPPPNIEYLVASICGGFMLCYFLFVRQPSSSGGEESSVESVDVVTVHYFNPFYHVVMVPSFYYLYWQLLQLRAVAELPPNVLQGIQIAASVFAVIKLPWLVCSFGYYAVEFLWLNAVTVTLLVMVFRSHLPPTVYAAVMLTLRCVLGHFVYAVVLWLAAIGITLVLCKELHILPRRR